MQCACKIIKVSQRLCIVYTRTMLYLLLFVLQVAFLFFLSQQLSRLLSVFFLSITRSQKVTISLLSFLFLPGVIMHELAHWLVAEVLFVQTGEIEFLPQIQGDVVKLGSVAIAKTDPVRRLLIGIAPLFCGLSLLVILFFIFKPSITWPVSFITIAYGVILFEIGNTMFSSKRDLEGMVGFIVATLIIGIILFLGLRIQLPLSYFFQFVAFFQPALVMVTKLLIFVVLIDSILVGGLYLLLRKKY